MYGYGYGYYGFDWTYVLLIIGMLLSLAASTRLKSTFSYYRKIRSASGLTEWRQQRESFVRQGLQMYM